MPADLTEKQFELGDVVFGADAPVAMKVGGWNPGQATLRTSDEERPARDGVRFGRDYRGSAPWSFSLYTDQESEEKAWEKLSYLQRVWDADETRSESGAVLPLRYCVAGQVRRVYGRPRRFTPTPSEAPSLFGRIDIEATFDTVDQLVFDDVEQTFELGIGTTLTTTAGMVVPVVPPVSTTAGTQKVSRDIIIGGDRTTPFSVTFLGPVSDAVVTVGGVSVALQEAVSSTDPVTVDGRPWVAAATKQSGGGVKLSPRVTRISKMWLPPGRHTVSYVGSDPTSTSRVLVRWRNARRSPR